MRLFEAELLFHGPKTSHTYSAIYGIDKLENMAAVSGHAESFTFEVLEF